MALLPDQHSVFLAQWIQLVKWVLFPDLGYWGMSRRRTGILAKMGWRHLIGFWDKNELVSKLKYTPFLESIFKVLIREGFVKVRD